jgi:hypothetical protein
MRTIYVAVMVSETDAHAWIVYQVELDRLGREEAAIADVVEVAGADGREELRRQFPNVIVLDEIPVVPGTVPRFRLEARQLTDDQ